MIDKPESPTSIGPDPFEAANEPSPAGLGEPGPASYLGAGTRTAQEREGALWQSEQGEHLRQQLETIDEQLRTFARERPFVAVGSALLVGYLAGRLLSRF